MSKPNVYISDSINQVDTIKVNGNNVDVSIFSANMGKDDCILLYMYVLPNFIQHGVKVGMTKCRIGETYWHAIKSRIANQVHEVALPQDKYELYGLEREVLFWGICVDARSDSFKDYTVHKEIMQQCAGISERDQEWFLGVLPEDLIAVFNTCRHFDKQKEIYTPRKEQQDCIDALTEYFDKHPTDGRFLLNCKMRFGKSYTTYKYCEQANLNKILILTFVPAVESSWKEDLEHIEKEYRYITDRNIRQQDFELTDIDEPYVVFLSLQNYLGKDNKSNHVKEKIAKLQKVNFDLVVLDEYHFGAWNRRTQDTLDKAEKMEDLDEEYQKNLNKCEDVIQKFAIKTSKTICLSGTPFKALARGEFNNSSSFTYSYFDEQKNKYPVENDMTVIDPKYAHFPDMRIFGYNMSHLFKGLTKDIFAGDKILGKKYFSLNKFFETKADYNQQGTEFIYHDEVKNWLEIIKGRSTFSGNFPYGQNDMLLNNVHTLWLMPTVNSCVAMTELLKNDEYFSKYEIINLSAPEVPSGQDALDYLRTGMYKSKNTQKIGTIAVTVNKLTIGVTVKEWTSVFVLKDLASPEQYFQAIFRIQTPQVVDGEIKKKSCFVYDFNIDRASALILKYADEACRQDEQMTRMKIAQLIVKYLPIFLNGKMDEPISEQVFYELAQFGDQSNQSLSKKIRNTETTTNILDEETVACMLKDPEVSEIIKHVFAHAKFDKPKTRTLPNTPPDGSTTIIAKEGRDLGYQFGLDESKDYLFLDDVNTQKHYEEVIAQHIKDRTPSKYVDEQAKMFANGFIKGYDQGINAPIKKLKCGNDDGVKFANEVVKAKLGPNIHYTKETRVQIENVVRPFLNDINNIPEEYRGMLYKRWYVDSFRRAVQNELTIKIPAGEDDTTVEDADNVIQHILTRLFEFLYISVYRETTFDEIFKNADPDIFLAAVGITKQDFEMLNKYNIFKQDILNNYIREFFENESLGEKLDLSDEKIRDKYRNSFDWFGYGVE